MIHCASVEVVAGAAPAVAFVVGRFMVVVLGVWLISLSLATSWPP